MPKEKQTKGFGIENGQYIIIDPEEVAATIPESNKTLEIEAFIPCSDVDDVYFDKPYYLTPDKMGGDAFVALRDGMKKSNVAAIARTVLFRRMRTALIRPHGKGLIATTMNYDYEVRSSKKAFEEMPKLKIEGEMLDLAKHIIATKKGEFDPATFDDRYEAALADLVKAKMEGKVLPTSMSTSSASRSPTWASSIRSSHCSCPATTRRWRFRAGSGATSSGSAPSILRRLRTRRNSKTTRSW
ncbi:DNA end-binding protein Ku [Rhizobium mongolense]|uniref:DNA end-binding protein Ku n=1 Tax=Rhizobium mongolense TaxID=57676 RepID=A0ABR6IX52_9HYPH|nr:DNA end-binding protein Ku [Rhizobium mongolense]